MNHSGADRQRAPGPHTEAGAIPDELYAKRKKVYPREVHGWFATLRVAGVVLLLGLYYGLAWLPWDGRQAVLFDLPARKFYIFGWVFWPQDFIYLALLLILAAVALFFFTAIAGRLWCGYACPQTVWTEIFLWMERKIEGGRSQQMKLDRSAWDRRKLRLKLTKHVVWIAFSLWTGFTFVGYFTPIRELWGAVWSLQVGPWETFWILFYGFATYGNAGWMREQVCIYMCPYARFQSAMFDQDTLIISYDEGRGEPRGSRKKGVAHRDLGLGDCIDCTLCVQVCPTGIDIRNGLQYQCIGCAACIDVCDQVMDKMGYPRGLVRYTTERASHGGTTHVLRPRILVYSLILLLLVGALGWALATRQPLELDIIRDRNALYRTAPGGLVENVYTLRLVNMDERPRTFRIGVSGLDGLQLINRYGDVPVAAGAVRSVDVQARIDPALLQRPSTEIHFTLETVDSGPHLAVRQDARFIGPVAR